MTAVPSGWPAGLAPELGDALRGLAGAPRLLVALDFDGTLAPVVDVPGEARALPEARDAVLRLLDTPGTRVALVSGRSLESLVEVSDPPAGVLLVGSHGIELRLDDAHDPVGLGAEELARLETLRGVLDGVAGAVEGAWVEAKPAGFALHTRLASAPDARRAHELALGELRDRLDGVTVRSGKDILEFSVRSATKGDALERLCAHTAADAVLYAGDDATDEDAFAVLRPDDVGIKVGPGPTVAAFRVADPAEAAVALVALAALRQPGRAVRNEN
ncbi:MAG: trehalose-phosphatase [Microbacteriaceae bacterium]|nr:trehalose-phosphatase [Microbacteriaceae bacterium]